MAKRMKRRATDMDNIVGNFAGRPVRIILVVVSMIVVCFPLYWLITSAFKVKADYLAYPPILFPDKFTLDSFIEVFQKDQLLNNFLNTFIIAAGSTAISVL